ncbi:hypothetical protein NCS56_01505400 [Fusarium sp. Ph1]|nr:hypothetical protein NCS56_01505400 [Fusarium sp. Ph1]
MVLQAPGFVLFPGTFTSLSHASLLSQSQAGRTVQGVVRNTPLPVVGILCCTLGIASIVWISWGLRSNYVWLRDRMLVPELLNSAVALLTSLINVYTAHDGEWSVTAIVTVCIVGSWGALMGALLGICEFWFSRKLRQETQ